MTFLTSVVHDYRASLRDEAEPSSAFDTPRKQKKPLAPRSRVVYMTHLNTFVRWCSAEDQAERIEVMTQLTPRVLRRYQRCLEQTHRPRTVIQTIYALRRFFSWCVEEGYLPSDPAADLSLPQPDASTRAVPTAEMVTALLAAPPRISGTPARKLLAAALLAIFAYAGLRRSEALSLRVKDFDRRERTLYVMRGKGNKERTVVIGEKTVAAIAAYLAVRPQSVSEFLFLYNAKMRFGTGALTVLMADLRAACDYPEERALQPHSLRHAYASKMAEMGIDLKTIQEQLGHSNLVTTQVYIHSSAEQKHRAAQVAESVSNATPAPALRLPEPEKKPRERRFNRVSRR